MILEVVETPKQKKDFLNLVDVIYRDIKPYVRPLDSMIEARFSPEENDCFAEGGKAIRYILKDDQGTVIGRIAAFVNAKKAYGYNQPTGGVGFFECIDNQEAANLLLNTSKEWLIKQGMEAMDGPINFGENELFWGCLTDGFQHSPGFGMAYNPPYYQKLFEAYGFETYFDQTTRHLDLDKTFPERFWRIAERVRGRKGFTFEHFKNAQAEKYINDILEIYADAWQHHENFKPLSFKDVEQKYKEIKAFLVEDFVWLGYFEGEPISFLIMYPDLNHLFKHINGKLSLWNKLKVLWLFKKRKITRSRMIMMGIKPKFQRSGVESGMIWNLNEAMPNHTEYKEIELSWIGDFNPKMQAIATATNADYAKTHRTYRYMFDGSPVEKATKI